MALTIFADRDAVRLTLAQFSVTPDDELRCVVFALLDEPLFYAELATTLDDQHRIMVARATLPKDHDALRALIPELIADRQWDALVELAIFLGDPEVRKRIADILEKEGQRYFSDILEILSGDLYCLDVEHHGEIIIVPEGGRTARRILGRLESAFLGKKRGNKKVRVPEGDKLIILTAALMLTS